ncbi:hypothetical protein CDAR_596341 [Caerostris darwini]|uniref:Gustatory receptor n=1 Tax=Caerostris darwini TaxID=1538125 RepID=A0AAV4UXE7_9ARAC|nr:hypothetical protein CDAR_596341 [Caerostris darwini]
MANGSSPSYDHIKQVKVPLQITITSSVISGEAHLTPNLNTNKNGFQCIRCGISMDKTKSIFINIQPAPLLQAKTNQSNMSMEILSKCSESNMSLEPAEDSCRQCGLSSSLHAGKLPEGKSCSDFNQNKLNISSSTESDSVCSEDENFTAAIESVSDISPEKPCINLHTISTGFVHPQQLKTPLFSHLEIEHQSIHYPCTDCHVVVLNELLKDHQSGDQEAISLMLQVSCSIPTKESIECQTVEDFSRNDIGIDWNRLGMHPEIDGDLLSYSLACLMITELIFAVILNIGVILCASRISYRVFRVQTTLQVMHNKVGTAEPKTLQIVKNMIDIKFSEMTAYGIVKLNPALIVSSFGSVLTYGLLVINVNRP